MSLSSLPGTRPQAGQATQAALYNAVFGEGSDVSSLSDSEDEQPRRRLPFPPRAAPVLRSASPENRDGEEDEDRDDEDDVYVPGTISNAAKIPRFKKVRSGGAVVDGDDELDGDGDGEGEGGKADRKRRSKKKRRVEGGKRRTQSRDKGEEEEAAPVYDESTRELDGRLAESRLGNVFQCRSLTMYTRAPDGFGRADR